MLCAFTSRTEVGFALADEVSETWLRATSWSVEPAQLGQR